MEDEEIGGEVVNGVVPEVLLMLELVRVVDCCDCLCC